MGSSEEGGIEEKDEASPTPDDGKKRRKRKRKRKAKEDAVDGKHDDDHQADESQTKKDGDIPAVDQKKTSEVDRTVYVEGIPFVAQPQQVKDFFQNGITGADSNLIVECRLPVWHDSGRLRGYGHIVFDTVEHYDCALKLSGKYLMNRYIAVQPAKKPKEHDGPTSEPSNKLMLHNLAYDATEEDIDAVMNKFGEISKGGIRIVRHSGTNQSKGFCYVEYEELESAKAAANARIQILGRSCRVDFDHGRVRGSFRTADRKLWQKEYGSKNE